MVDTRVLTKTRSEIAGRLLNAALRNVDITTTVSVTISNGGNTSILTGGSYTSGIDYRDGTKVLQVGGGLVNTAAPVVYNNGGFSFVTDAPSVEVWMRGGVWELWINGRPANGSPFTSPGDGFKRIDFGSAEPRVVELRFRKLVLGGGGSLVARKPYSIWPTPNVMPKVAVIGDSLTDAVTFGDLTAPYQGFAMRLGRMLNWDTIAMGSGGTGYTVGGAGSILNRVEQLLSYTDTEMVVLAGGINDNGATPTDLTAAVSASIARARQILPNALIAVLGPFRAPGRNPSQAISDAIKAGFDAVADSKMTFVDQYAQNWLFGTDPGVPGYAKSGELTFALPLVGATSAMLTTPWAGATDSTFTLVFDTGATKTVTLTNGSSSVSWTGAITAGTAAYAYTATAGNSSIYLPTDTIHWGPAGHLYVACRVRDALLTWFRSIV